MVETEKTLNTKLVQLHLNAERTESILQTGKQEVIERHLAALKATIAEVDQHKRTREAEKIAEKQDLHDITKWVEETNAKVAEADIQVERIQEWLTIQKRKGEEHLREEQLKHEMELHQLRMKLQSELHAAKAEMETHPEQSSDSEGTKGLQAKLPKLTITPFNGSYQDWPRFWGQFVETIDKTGIASITKFTYLRELLGDKVIKSVQALPFTSEGYNRAKSILQDRYGKDSEITKAYTRQIFDLPLIPTANVRKIHEFSEVLMYAVQSLETMKRLEQVNGYVAMTLDKLPAIRGDLVRTDPEWESWDFIKLADALKAWAKRNPIDDQARERHARQPDDSLRKGDRDRSKLYNTQQRTQACVYCDMSDHKPSECQKVKTTRERRIALIQKRLCFNCAKPSHRASECKSKVTCQKCSRRHHTSICEAYLEESKEKMLGANDDADVVYPVILVEVDGIKTRALLDTGAGSSYASAKLISALRKQPVETKTKTIDMMIGSTRRRVEMYNAEVKSIDGKFSMIVNLTKVHKQELLRIDNPKYKGLISKYSHLKDVQMDDVDTKEELPVHLVLAAAEYSRIKTDTPQRVGREYEPVGEHTKLGWVLMAPGQRFDRELMLLTQTSHTDYEQLCRLDVLGLEDSAEDDQQAVYEEFKEQLQRSPEGWYETALPWKGNHPTLPNNRAGSLKRLESLVRKLEKQGELERYDNIIKDQLTQGIVEHAEEEVEGREFYIPHKAVLRDNAESTKMRIVYDASARATATSPSLNECLETGPPLQNQLWSVLTRNRFYPVAIAGDIKQAFLQVRVREADRDALRFHWLKDLKTKQVEVLRFTRALFGLGPSPFLLAAVIKEHLRNCRPVHPKIVEEIERSLYVDDLIGGGGTTEKALEVKQTAQSVFGEATFELHKWHSNVPSLEAETVEAEDTGQSNVHVSEADVVELEESYAKQQLGTKKGESKLLGVPWDKKKDQIEVSFPVAAAEPTKRGILGKIAKIYDPLGLVSPVTLAGKVLCRDVCDLRIAWDTPLPWEMRQKWTKWEENLPKQASVPRSLAVFQEGIQSIDLHGFGDASGTGVSATVYAVVQQPSGVTTALVAAKSRLAKKGLTIPRLELVAGHMVTNLVENVKEALEGLPLRNTHGWLDSTVALHWIRGDGHYMQFVKNRVEKIRKKSYIQWRHVPTEDNPSDVGSRGGTIDKLTALWWQGPNWLSDPQRWPPDIMTSSSKESAAEEVKAVRELFAVALEKRNDLDELLEKHELWRALRVGAWIVRFLRNMRVKREKRDGGPLTTEEIERQRMFWIKRAQQQAKATQNYEKDSLQLNVQTNQDGVQECRGRIQGSYPIYLDDTTPYTRKLVERSHLDTLHGGVTLTMAKVRERYWVPRLRKLTKQVIKSCAGCKRFQAIALSNPPPGPFPLDRTQGSTPFEVIGVDFAGPIKYRIRSKKEGKAYIALYSCSLTRAIYLDVTQSLETSEFVRSLKRFIARRGRPVKIYSDNGKTFVGAEKWLKQIMRDEQVQDYLAHQNIKWQFNLSRAPWWGGQFERLIGLVKSSLNKTIGNGMLSWKELCEVILDVEIAVNSRPISYVEEDVEQPLLTPNSFLFQRSNQMPELEAHHLKDVDLRKRARHLRKCKQALWSRWSNEYMRGLRERHKMKHDGKLAHLTKGEVVIVKDDDRNRAKWKLGIVEDLIAGSDGIVRVAKLRAGKTTLERAVQQLYPLELSCDRETTERSAKLNPETPAFRPRRDAAVAANFRIKNIALDAD